MTPAQIDALLGARDPYNTVDTLHLADDVIRWEVKPKPPGPKAVQQAAYDAIALEAERATGNTDPMPITPRPRVNDVAIGERMIARRRARFAWPT